MSVSKIKVVVDDDTTPKVKVGMDSKVKAQERTTTVKVKVMM